MARSAGVHTPWWAALLLCAAAAVPFARTLRHDLVWDDRYLVADVETLAAQGGLAAVAAAPFLPEQNEPDNYYRPVVLLSLWLDGRLAGGSAAAFHVTNLVLHVLNSLLVAWLLREVLRSSGAALAGALVFAVHPVQVEAVAFVAARTDLFAAFFVLLAAVTWLGARRARPRARQALVAVSAACLLAGILAKETAIVLPLVLLVADAVSARHEARAASWWPRNRTWLLAYAGAALLVALLRVGALGTVFSVSTPEAALQGPLLLREPTTALAGAIRMLRVIVIPFPLNSLYTREHLVIDTAAWVAVLALAALVVWLATARRQHVGWIAAAWIVLFLAPSLLVPSGAATLIAERYLYLPMVGVALLAGASWSRRSAGATAPAHAAWPGWALLILVLGWASFARAAVWRSDLDLTADQLRTAPRSAFAYDLRGQALLEAKRWPEALDAFQRAVALDPDDSGYQNDLGIGLRRVGRPDLAVEAFRKSLAIAPARPGTRLNLAYACISLRDLACVEEQRRALTRLDPAAQRRLEQEMARWGLLAPSRP